jgi:1,4-dihydroxy-2-naphthoate octaprenyltransferase
MATETITQWQAWKLAARPKTLPAALSPVVVGTALAFADGGFVWLPALAAAMGALLLQILSNFANDYSDFFRGADTPDRLGPVRVTSAGIITPAVMRKGIIVVIAAAALVGLYLIWVGGWPILLIGVAGIVAALAYTGGPFPFGYYGLGEFFVFLFFGVAAVCGTYYVQALTLTPAVVTASFAVGALVTAILVVNNYRDIDTDRTRRQVHAGGAAGASWRADRVRRAAGVRLSLAAGDVAVGRRRPLGADDLAHGAAGRAARAHAGDRHRRRDAQSHVGRHGAAGAVVQSVAGRGNCSGMNTVGRFV